MNPADQQRKQDRRKELKRNKKQRQQVRSAVLKGKDCEDLIAQMRRLDEMEFLSGGKPSLPERVIQEKRQKIRETYHRVLGHLKKEPLEADRLAQARKLLNTYDEERNQMMEAYLAEKFARDIPAGEIPLPGGLAMPGSEMTPVLAIPSVPSGPGFFPPHMLLPEQPTAPPPSLAPPSILKKVAAARAAQPPGPPSGLPPDLSDSDSDEDDDDDDDDDEEDEETTSSARKGVRFAGVEQEEKDSRTKYKQLAKRIAEEGGLPHEDEEEEEPEGEFDPADVTASVTGLGRIAHYSAPPSIAYAAPGAGRFMRPPPPPPGMPPSRMLGAAPPPIAGIRPGGPSIAARGPIGPRPAAPPPTNAAVIQAEPTVAKKTGPVIEAKPQLRNMQKEVVKLIPTAIRVRRELQVSLSFPASALLSSFVCSLLSQIP